MKTSRKEVSVDATRARILKASLDIFARKGYKAATIREISDKAGVNLAAVNYYFRSKETLYMETCRNVAAHYMALHAELAGPAPTTAAAWRREVYRVVKVLLEFFSCPHNKARRRLAEWERMQPSAIFPALVREFHAPVSERLQALLELALPPGDVVSAQIWRVSIYSQCEVYSHASGSVRPMLVPEGLSHEEWLERTADIIAGAVVASLKFRKGTAVRP